MRNENCALSICLWCVCVYGCVRKLCVNASERVCACECGCM